MANKHWLWYAYLALGEQGGMTESQGRDLLKRTFPTFSELVDTVVANRGDRNRLSEAQIRQSDESVEQGERDTASLDMNAEIRRTLQQRRNAEEQPRHEGRFVAASDNASMNEAIRDALKGRRITIDS